MWPPFPFKIPLIESVSTVTSINALVQSQTEFTSFLSLIFYNKTLNYITAPCTSIIGGTICSFSPYDYYYIDSVWNLIRKPEVE
jgi:hypothetical protein